MTDTRSTLSRHDLEAKIVKRCWEDESFRKEFIADPAGAFVKYLKVSASSLPQIVAHQEPANTWHIVLPTKPANADELSDADLERVAGGIPTPSALATLIVSASLVSVASVGAASVAAGQTLDDGW